MWVQIERLVEHSPSEFKARHVHTYWSVWPNFCLTSTAYVLEKDAKQVGSVLQRALLLPMTGKRGDLAVWDLLVFALLREAIRRFHVSTSCNKD
jgi:hypothetical protein